MAKKIFKYHPDEQPALTKHWLECNSPNNCGGVYEFQTDKFVCDKCGDIMEAAVDDDGCTINFGGITSYNNSPSFHVNLKPGDKLMMYKEDKAGNPKDISKMKNSEKMIIKDFSTDMLNNKKIEMITVEVIYNVIVTLE